MTAPMSHRLAPPSRLSQGGFTLIEALVVCGITAILSSLAYPSFEAHVLRARRTDAMVALMQAQLAQERFRADNTVYGSLAQIGMRGSTAAGYYSLEMRNSASDAYEVVAAASGVQAHDADCRTLRLVQRGDGLVYASGPSAAASNPADVNRRCWNQ